MNLVTQQCWTSGWALVLASALLPPVLLTGGSAPLVWAAVVALGLMWFCSDEHRPTYPPSLGQILPAGLAAAAVSQTTGGSVLALATLWGVSTLTAHRAIRRTTAVGVGLAVLAAALTWVGIGHGAIPAAGGATLLEPQWGSLRQWGPIATICGGMISIGAPPARRAPQSTYQQAEVVRTGWTFLILACIGLCWSIAWDARLVTPETLANGTVLPLIGIAFAWVIQPADHAEQRPSIRPSIALLAWCVLMAWQPTAAQFLLLGWAPGVLAMWLAYDGWHQRMLPKGFGGLMLGAAACASVQPPTSMDEALGAAASLLVVLFALSGSTLVDRGRRLTAEGA